MKQKPLQHDLFLYEFAIRMLAVLATLLFSLLFFYGMIASGSKGVAGNGVNKTNTAQIIPNTNNQFASLGDMH